MRLIVVILLIIFVTSQHVTGYARCTCNCCRGEGCVPVKQTSFAIDSCDSDSKCNLPCCQRYPEVCFPLPGPGVVDSVCQNVINHKS
jgi:hypothetical protein